MILKHKGSTPRIAETAFLAPGACVIGNVRIGEESSLWFNVVVRGDVNYIRIGDRTNIQDGTIVHVTRDTHPTIVGNDVSVGHGVILHGCNVHDNCLIGIGAIILDGCRNWNFLVGCSRHCCGPGNKNSTAFIGYGPARACEKGPDRGRMREYSFCRRPIS